MAVVKTTFQNPVSAEFTGQFLDQGLYVDKAGKQFKSWWTSPEQNFTRGGVFSILQSEAGIEAVGVIKIQDPLRGRAAPDGTEVILLGAVGFVVKPEHRGLGIAPVLAQSLEEQVLKTFNFPQDAMLVVLATGASQNIISRYCQRIITSIDANKIMYKMT